MDVRRLLVGPGRTALRVGLPVVVAVAALTAVSTTLILRSNSGGGVYWPLDAVAVAVAASAVYAVRYRAAVVCVAIGAAAVVGSDVGFHALHGNDAVVETLVEIVRRPEPAAIGAVFGAIGAGAGGVVGRVLRVRRQRAA